MSSLWERAYYYILYGLKNYRENEKYINTDEKKKLLDDVIEYIESAPAECRE